MTIRFLLILCASLNAILAVGCVTDANPVRPNAVVRDLPISPEGRWHDLQAMASRPASDPKSVLNLFSYTLLIGQMGDVPQVSALPPEAEAYRLALETLDAQYRSLKASNGDRLVVFASGVMQALAAWRQYGIFYTEAPVVNIRHRNADDYPYGPNRCTLNVVFRPYPHLRTQIEAQTFVVQFVQEHEFWKIETLDQGLLVPPGIAD